MLLDRPLGFERHRSGAWVPEGLERRLSDRCFDYARRHRAQYGLWPLAGGSQRQFMAYNGASPTTAAAVKVTTGAAIKTMQQVQTSASRELQVVEWGISFDGVAGTPIECELLSTGAVAATVTAYAAADIIKWGGPNDAGSSVTLGTAASGYTATAEGTITATRLGDLQLVSQAYVKQFPLGREFEMAVSTNLRVRVTAAVALNAYTYIVWEE